MSGLSILFVASALATAGPQVTVLSKPEPSSKPASISFVSRDKMLVGTVYGISAIDAQAQVYGKLLSASVLAGNRTVWYSCPNAPAGSDRSRIAFDFVAGQHYELVCDAAKGAVIRAAEEC
jgi:hypothetical protein